MPIIGKHFRSRIYGRGSAALLACASLLVASNVFGSEVSATPLSGQSTLQVSIFTTFPSGEVCCGISDDSFRYGLLFATVTGDSAGAGKVIAIAPDGTQFPLIPTPISAMGSYGPTSLALNPQGRLFVQVDNYPVSTGSDYELGLNGQWATVPGTNQIGLPDDMVFDQHGDLYVTDDVPGNSHVWRVTPGGAAQIWSSSPQIQGGANSVEVIGDAAYVSVTESGTMVRIPIEPDGSAGPAAIIASDPTIAPVDDGVYDPVTGDVYLTSLLGNEFVQITPSGATSVLANGPLNGLYTPTNLDLVQSGRHAVIYVSGTALQSLGAPSNAVSEILKVTLR